MHSHHHLLSFSVLALVMMVIFSSTVVAEEKTEQSPSGQSTPSVSPQIPQHNNQPSGPDGGQPMKEQNNQPGEQKDMMNNLGRPEFNNNQPQGDAPGNEMGNKKGKQFDNPGNQMNFPDMNQKNSMNFGQNDQQRIDQQRFGGDQGMNNNFGNNKKSFGPDQSNGMGMDSDSDNEAREAEDQARRDKQMVQNAQRQIKNMESTIKQFDRQVESLTKKGVKIPANFSDSLAKIKSTIAAVKSAKTADELEATEWEDLPSEISDLHEGRKMLEQLARWPKMLKQIDKQLATLNRDLKKYKTQSEKLESKGISVMSVYQELETSVTTLKQARDEAVAKVGVGDIEAAYDILEDKFYDAFEEIYEKARIIQTMNNIRRFPSDFKKAQKQMGQTIAKLKRQKINTTELEQIEATINQKGVMAQSLMKAKPFDADALMDALEELFGLRQEFMDKIQSMTGESSDNQDKQNNNEDFNANFSLPTLN